MLERHIQSNCRAEPNEENSIKPSRKHTRKTSPRPIVLNATAKSILKRRKHPKKPAGSDEKVEKPPKFKYIRCKKRCGCLTDFFCQRAQNSFSNILSTCESAAEFRARLRGHVHTCRIDTSGKKGDATSTISQCAKTANLSLRK